MNSIPSRIRRMYKAFDSASEDDLGKFPSEVVETAEMKVVVQDFSGGMDDDEMHESVVGLINHVANLRNHLFAWAGSHGIDKSAIDDAVRKSDAIKICLDLADVERHGAGRPGKQTKKVLTLEGVARCLRLSTGEGEGSQVTLVMVNNKPQIVGTSGAEGMVAFRGDVVDAESSVLGDIWDIVADAIADWESLLRELGLFSPEALDT